MPKFGYEENSDYVIIAAYLEEMAEQAPTTIERNWRNEDGVLNSMVKIPFESSN